MTNVMQMLENRELCLKSHLTEQQLKGLYHIEWTKLGANNHGHEEDTVYCLEQFLRQVIISRSIHSLQSRYAVLLNTENTVT